MSKNGTTGAPTTRVRVGIGTRLIIGVGGIVALAIAGITMLIALRMREVLLHNGMERGADIAARWAGAVQTELNRTFDAARTLAGTLQAAARSGGELMSREGATELLRQFIETSPEHYDVYAGFEPNAFDGRDQEFVDTPGHDGTGRFIPVWSRDEAGRGVLEALLDYETAGDGDYYQLPRSRNRETIVDPYHYPMQGEDVLMTSLLAPVRNQGGAFIGIVGIDVPLERIQTMAKTVKVEGLPGAYVNVYSADGTIAANKNPEAVGQNVEVYYKDFRVMVDAVQDGATTVVTRYSSTVKSNVYTFLHAVEIAGTGSRWSVGVSIPEKELLAQVRSATVLILLVGLSALLAILAVVVIQSRNLSTRIRLVTQGATLLAEGDAELTGLDSEKFRRLTLQNNELGDIGRAFQTLIGYFRLKVEVARKIAAKDLTVQVAVSSERDGLGMALTEMTTSLNTFLSDVNRAAEQVSSGGSQVSAASQSLSQGATEQASSIEEISASVTQITGQTRQNSENAVQANSLSKLVMESAQRGNERMKEMQEAMTRIMGSSVEIKKVVKAIDDIAFQINLLALNANVEAARAGKYGKGFAVVADEVRNLAVRSAQSVRETTAMVESSVKSTSEGSELLTTTAAQLAEILEGAGKSADLVEEIASASLEQAQALEQITEGLGQIDQVTQANTASAEESAAASEELSSQARELRTLVAAFKIQSAGVAGAAAETTGAGGGATPHVNGRVNGHVNGHANGSGRRLVAAAVTDPNGIIRLDDDGFGRF